MQTNDIGRHLPLTGAPSIISNFAIVSFSLYELEPEVNNTCKQVPAVQLRGTLADLH